MIVREDDARGIASERLLDDFARIHARPVDRAAKEFAVFDQPVPRIEKQRREHFVLERADPQRRKFAHRLGRAERGARRTRRAMARCAASMISVPEASRHAPFGSRTQSALLLLTGDRRHDDILLVFTRAELPEDRRPTPQRRRHRLARKGNPKGAS